MKRSLPVVLLAALCGVAVADTSAEEELLAGADAMVAKVSKLRGLRVKRTIKRGVMNDAQLRERLRKRIDEQYSKEELAAESLGMKRFGLLDKDADYLKVVLNLLTSQVAGFYDPFARELYIAKSSGFGGDMLLAHEIDHALQDQHFDLKRFMTAEKANADASAARQALVEGDGVALMMEHLLDGMGKSPPWGEPKFAEEAASMTRSQADSIKDAPFALREALVFPYADGLRFVAHFRKHHGWNRINKIFKKPPLSTEHILHAELYERYEKPLAISVTIPGALSGYDATYKNVMGEKGLSIMLEAHGVTRERASSAAAGWGGDAVVVFSPPGHTGSVSGTIGVLRLRFDSEADAIEFYEAASHALPSLSGNGDLVADGPDGALRYRNSNGAVVSVQRVLPDVAILVGAPPAREPEIRAAALAWPAK